MYGSLFLPNFFRAFLLLFWIYTFKFRYKYVIVVLKLISKRYNKSFITNNINNETVCLLISFYVRFLKT